MPKLINVDCKKLAIARAEKGMTLMELANKTGVGHSTISRIENGEVAPTLRTVAKLAKGLDEPIDSFLI